MAGFDFIFASNASSFLALNAKYSSSQVNGGHSNINLGYSTSASLLQLQSQFLFLINGRNLCRQFLAFICLIFTARLSFS